KRKDRRNHGCKPEKLRRPTPPRFLVPGREFSERRVLFFPVRLCDPALHLAAMAHPRLPVFRIEILPQAVRTVLILNPLWVSPVPGEFLTFRGFLYAGKL